MNEGKILGIVALAEKVRGNQVWGDLASILRSRCEWGMMGMGIEAGKNQYITSMMNVDRTMDLIIGKT